MKEMAFVLIFLCLGLHQAVAQNTGSSTTPQKIAEVKKAAEQGDAQAQNELGVSYESGDGVPKDPTQAVVW